MKITFLNTNDYGGGAAVAAQRIAGAINAHTPAQARVLVQDKQGQNPIVTGLTNTWWKKKVAFARFVGERLSFLPYERNTDVRFAFNPANFGLNISANPLITTADILHLHWTTFGFLSVKNIGQLMALHKPIVWTMHDMWAFTGGCHHSGTCENYQHQCGHCAFVKNPSEQDFSHQIWQNKYKSWQNTQPKPVAVACSEWLANRARKSSLMQGWKVLAIPNPIDTQVFSPAEKTESRKALNLDPHKNYILFVAMKVEAIGKGFAYLKEALYRGNFDANTTELLVMGQAKSEDFDNLPLKVNYLGHLSDTQRIAQAYQAATVFVIPSLEENLPNTIMEALACGTPAVGFAVGGIPEMITTHHNGYLAKYQDAPDLAQGLTWVLNHTDYQKLSQNARQKVLDNYTEEVVAKKYLTVYQEFFES